MIISEYERYIWLKDYVNAQLRENNDRWVEANTELEQVQIEFDNLTKRKAHYEAIISILKTVQKNLIPYPNPNESPSVDNKQTKEGE